MKVRHCRVVGVSDPGQCVALSDSVTVPDPQRTELQVCEHYEQAVIEFDHDHVPCRGLAWQRTGVVIVPRVRSA